MQLSSANQDQWKVCFKAHSWLDQQYLSLPSWFLSCGARLSSSWGSLSTVLWPFRSWRPDAWGWLGARWWSWFLGFPLLSRCFGNYVLGAIFVMSQRRLLARHVDVWNSWQLIGASIAELTHLAISCHFSSPAFDSCLWKACGGLSAVLLWRWAEASLFKEQEGRFAVTTSTPAIQ